MTSEAVRHSMQGNRSKDTKPELKVRAMLREMGFPGDLREVRLRLARHLRERLLLAPLPSL